MGRGRPRLSTIKMSPSFDKYTSNRIKQLQYALGKGGLTDKDERSIRDEIIKIQDDRTKFDPFKKGGSVKKKLKPVPKGNKGLKKLPTQVRNKMGFMKKGGIVKRGTSSQMAGREFKGIF